MTVNDDLCVLPISIKMPGRTMLIHLALIVDPERGPTLVDASMPGTENLISDALVQNGFELGGLRRVLITHQDIDHIGALAAVKEASGAEILAHRIEAPYIEGKTPLVKIPSEERLAQNPWLRERFHMFRYVQVDVLLEDLQLLDIAGGVRVILTPGHAPGHVSYFLERSKILIAGDALTAENGSLQGPNPSATPNMPLAIESVRKLAELPDVRAIVAYHGGVIEDDARGQLIRLSESLDAEG